MDRQQSSGEKQGDEYVFQIKGKWKYRAPRDPTQHRRRERLR
jgi:hypothetical protein